MLDQVQVAPFGNPAWIQTSERRFFSMRITRKPRPVSCTHGSLQWSAALASMVLKRSHNGGFTALAGTWRRSASFDITPSQSVRRPGLGTHNRP